MGRVLLAAGLVLYNTLANRWTIFRGWAYVPMNLAASAAVASIGAGPLGLSSAAMGFGAGWGSDVAIGLAMGAAVSVPVFVAARYPRTHGLVADERVRGLSGATLVYRVLVRVPLGTALLEELAFRGVLYGSLRPHGALATAVGSAVPFGLWHISPTVNQVRVNRPEACPRDVIRAVVAGVLLTGLAGVGFAGLRAWTGTLGVPLGLHAALNSLASLAAIRATRLSAPA